MRSIPIAEIHAAVLGRCTITLAPTVSPAVVATRTHRVADRRDLSVVDCDEDWLLNMEFTK